jgi:ATP-binding cassette subfamily B protein
VVAAAFMLACAVPALRRGIELRDAARRAGAHDFVAALPLGYDTVLSRIFTDNVDREDPATGVVLSGGQLQRLAPARALLRDQRDLLILDEPSAGLDAEAEEGVYHRLYSLQAKGYQVEVG